MIKESLHDTLYVPARARSTGLRGLGGHAVGLYCASLAEVAHTRYNGGTTKRADPGGRLFSRKCAAVSYSPARPPSQYHRR